MTTVPINSDTVIALPIGSINGFDISADKSTFTVPAGGIGTYNLRIGITMPPPSSITMGSYQVYIMRGISKFYAKANDDNPYLFFTDITIGCNETETWSVHVVNNNMPTAPVSAATAVTFKC